MVFKFFRRRKAADAVATYQVETTPTQLKIIRTHMAAQAGELANLRTQIGSHIDYLDHHSNLLNEILDHLKTGEADQ